MKFKFLPVVALALGMLSCTENDDNTIVVDPELTEKTYNIVGEIDGAYYLANLDIFTSGSFSFVNNGSQLDADQAARIIEQDGYIYSLDYGTGLLSQLTLNTTTGAYDVVKEINAGLAVGTSTPRFKKSDDNTIMVYNVEVTPIYDGDVVVENTCTLRLASINIPEVTVGNLTEFNIPQTDNAKLGATIGYHPMRVDAPVISGDKIYFGLMHLDMSNPNTPPPFRQPKQTGLETLVFDYPSFENGAITESSAGSGHTTGYRAPSMHVDENGDVYQSNWFMSGSSFDLSAGDKTVITRLKNGIYDDSYVFNVSEALGLTSNVATVGWFYAGNGIGYMPIQLEDEGNYYSENSWSLAKIDVYNKTAVKLEVPMSNLFAYENGVVVDGKFYMAISPIGAEGAIYAFDVESNTFDTTVTLEDESASVEGIY